MRIIGGVHGGRKFNPPGKMPHTRPTTDVAKEGLFNIIENNLDISSLKTLDIFGGTGSISYELASRGAKDLTVVERDFTMSEFIKKTASELKLSNFKVLRMDVFKFLESAATSYDFIFAGPPYSLGNIDDLPQIIFQKNLLNKNGWFILEHTPRNTYQQVPYYVTERNYGTTIFSIFINK
ncbi:MAG TPA: RsmD family RNA methyltransferase [Chitinophagaceae bacterium]|nr:RsmD family RNA methyltransferase [Chitinophagaceae bacterium]